MLGASFLKRHRTWEDWAGIALGVLVLLTPAVAGTVENGAAMFNAALIGIAIVALAAFEFVDLRRWEEFAELACGLWLVASPFILGYEAAGVLAYWHFSLGAIVAVLASLEIWQDWRLSAGELAKHGQ
jgi:hypothetical protein